MTHLACYQCTGQQSDSLLIWGCIRAFAMISSNIWKGIIDAEIYKF